MATPVQGQTAQGGFTITPSNTVDAKRPFDALYIGGAGDVTLVAMSGETVLYPSVPAGTQLQAAGTRVNSTGTTATLITGMTF
jgi:hypothetical protein